MFGTELATSFKSLKTFMLGDEILIKIFDNKYVSVNKLVITS